MRCRAWPSYRWRTKVRRYKCNVKGAQLKLAATKSKPLQSMLFPDAVELLNRIACWREAAGAQKKGRAACKTGRAA